MFIGIDDTDSEKGLCTTYLSAVLMERLRALGAIKGLPKLIRLNPCARIRLAAMQQSHSSLRAKGQRKSRIWLFRTVLEFSDLSGGKYQPRFNCSGEYYADEGLLSQGCHGDPGDPRGARALRSEGIWYRGLKKGRGLIGALAAIGAELRTYL